LIGLGVDPAIVLNGVLQAALLATLVVAEVAIKPIDNGAYKAFAIALFGKIGYGLHIYI
jgi:hypothetical protein